MINFFRIGLVQNILYLLIITIEMISLNKKSVVLFIILTTYVLLFMSCKRNYNYLNGEIITVNIPEKTDTLYGKTITLDGVYTGKIFAYDSLIIFMSKNTPIYQMSVYSLSSMKQIGSFCQYGNGPNESRFFTHYNQYKEDDTGLHLWMNMNNYLKLSCINISQSIIEQRSIFDSTKIDIVWRNHFDVPFLRTFVLNNDTCIVKNQSMDKFSKSIDYIPGAYHLYSIKTKEIIKTYTLFNNPIINKRTGNKRPLPKEVYLGSTDAIKPDRSKIAMLMWHMGQFNILNIETGEITGYRLSETPDFNSLIYVNPYDFVDYFDLISVDDDYIYASYCGQKNTPNPVPYNRILIFNWDGNFINSFYTDNIVSHMTVDPVNKILYILDIEDVLHSYNLNSLLNK